LGYLPLNTYLSKSQNRKRKSIAVPIYQPNGLMADLVLLFENKKDCRQKEYYLNLKTKLIGAGVQDSCEETVQGRPRRRKGDEEASGPSAESECIEWKSTVKLKKLKKL
jgi:hypothetical protein